jgi:hypothetical protein
MSVKLFLIFLCLMSDTSDGIPRVIFVICSTEQEFRVVFSSAEWFGTEFQVFSSIFVPWHGIPSCFLFCGMVRNGIPRVFCSAEQPEFRRNQATVPSIPSSEKKFFCRKLPTLERNQNVSFIGKSISSLSENNPQLSRRSWD